MLDDILPHHYYHEIIASLISTFYILCKQTVLFVLNLNINLVKYYKQVKVQGITNV